MMRHDGIVMTTGNGPLLRVMTPCPDHLSRVTSRVTADCVICAVKGAFQHVIFCIRYVLIMLNMMGLSNL